jgi:hypothetical protein
MNQERRVQWKWSTAPLSQRYFQATWMAWVKALASQVRVIATNKEVLKAEALAEFYSTLPMLTKTRMLNTKVLIVIIKIELLTEKSNPFNTESIIKTKIFLRLSMKMTRWAQEAIPTYPKATTACKL